MGVLCLSHDTLTDPMVGIFLKTRLLSRYTLAFGQRRPIVLKIFAAVGKLAMVVIKFCSAENLPVAVDGYVHDPLVNA
jgi:hypothetical protein